MRLSVVIVLKFKWFKNISFQLFNFQVFSIEQANASASATRPNGMIWTNAYLVGLMSRITKSEHSLALSQVSAKAKMSILLSKTKLSLIWRDLLLIDLAFRRQKLSSFADGWCSGSCLIGETMMVGWAEHIQNQDLERLPFVRKFR